MAYEVTATRKRPQTLNALLDQEFVVATLRGSIEQGRIAHAYIFSGPRGVGKTSAARILAKSLNCEQGPTAEPCGQCSICQEISQGSSLDVIEIDGASNTSVNDVREIKDEVLFAPNSCRYKVYIIDEVHMLSNSAFNALLKTIEEPPPYIVFIFATTEIHKVPATIRSRCQQFNFKLISITRIKESLAQLVAELGLQAEDRALFWIAKEATGSFRDAYTLFDQIVSFSDKEITLEKIKEKLGIVGIDELNELIEQAAAGNSQQALVLVDRILAQGIAVEQFVIELVEYFRNILFLKHGIEKDHILGYPVSSFSSTVLQTFSAGQLEMAIEMLLELYRKLRFSASQRFELELALSRLAGLKDLVTQKELVQKIRGLKKELQSAGTGRVDDPPEQEQTSGQATEATAENSAQATSGGPINQGKAEQEATAEKPVPEQLLPEMIQLLHKNKKLTLASSLEKIGSWSLEDKTLVLNFHLRDKFSGELIKREKRTILDTVTALVGRPLILKINFTEDNNEDNGKDDERVGILKKIFNGEIVKGE